MSRERILHITIKDCDVQTFRVGGAGGQHKDKTSAGVRVVHRASGAMGQASDSRSQAKNKGTAFKRMAESDRFQGWLRIEHAKAIGETDAWVDEQMRPENLTVEYGPFEELAEHATPKLSESRRLG